VKTTDEAAGNPADITWSNIPQLPHGKPAKDLGGKGKELLVMPRSEAGNPADIIWSNIPKLPHGKPAKDLCGKGKELLVMSRSEAGNPADITWSNIPQLQHGKPAKDLSGKGKELLVMSWGDTGNPADITQSNIPQLCSIFWGPFNYLLVGPRLSPSAAEAVSAGQIWELFFTKEILNIILENTNR
jgi:hypothetical protein